MFGLLLALLGGSVSFSASAATVVDHLYDNSSDGSPAISLIQSATKTLDVEIYTMKDLNVIAAFKAAMVRGVKLRIIQTPNPVLDTCPVFKESAADTPAPCLELRAFVTYVNSNGGQYIPFSFNLCGVAGLSCYQHGKMIIADQKRAMISTGNLDASNLCDIPEAPSRCNRDFSAVSTDALVVKSLETIFNKDLLGEAYEITDVLKANSRVTASPNSMKPLIDFIASAKKSIQIENQYLNDPTMNDALIAAAGRGVKVFVMVSSVTAFGKLNPDDDQSKITKWTNNFTAFDHAGISSKIFDDSMKINGQSGYLHAKAILVDGVHAWIGSVNGSTKSLTQNREFGLFSDDKTFVKHLSDVLYSDFANRNAETWQQSLVCKKDACGSAARNAAGASSQSSSNSDDGGDNSLEKSSGEISPELSFAN